MPVTTGGTGPRFLVSMFPVITAARRARGWEVEVHLLLGRGVSLAGKLDDAPRQCLGAVGKVALHGRRLPAFGGGRRLPFCGTFALSRAFRPGCRSASQVAASRSRIFDRLCTLGGHLLVNVRGGRGRLFHDTLRTRCATPSKRGLTIRACCAVDFSSGRGDAARCWQRPVPWRRI